MSAKKIPCPECKTPLTWDTENPFRPFCSERCKLLDLGAWADGSYQVPVDPTSEDENDYSTSMVELENYKPPIIH